MQITFFMVKTLPLWVTYEPGYTDGEVVPSEGSWKGTHQVVDLAHTITTEGEFVGHSPHSILTRVESKFP